MECCFLLYGVLQVEQWLDKVQERMVNTLREKLGEAILAYEERPKDQWLFDYPAQVSVVIVNMNVAVVNTQIWWTTEVNIALTRLEEGKKHAVKDYFKKQVSQLNMLIKLLMNDHSQGDRQKIMTICTMDVHARDVVAKLISNKASSSMRFID
ncbi:Dynein heavy chain 11, axonemal [Merluccius polli]|uniref:Dynein heavy chain 11, axonemal n=1 Tax=Merluccius polli TaxID=89951 RepID=A0AA47P3D5_MERPO|nr:Dynein heavy chain 11, axonemal [Merluccius polli]